LVILYLKIFPAGLCLKPRYFVVPSIFHIVQVLFDPKGKRDRLTVPVLLQSPLCLEKGFS